MRIDGIRTNTVIYNATQQKASLISSGVFIIPERREKPLICIYPADCTDFSNNGLGAVTPMSCTVTETLNGEWELTLVHDIDECG